MKCSFTWHSWLPRALLIIAVGLWIYSPALTGGWLWDDDQLVTQNTALRSLTGLGTIWFFPPGPDYWPLTSTLFWIEWHLLGDAPLGYRIVSLALHLAGGFLVWRLLARLGLRQAWLGGLLFVIHPLAVESVAWISETKNTLSLPLGLLSLDAWLDHDEGKGRSGYARSLLLYLAAMLAKTSVIMLPAVLLLYVWWKRGRITREEVVRTIPYFVIALTLGIVTIFFQHTAGGAEASAAESPIARIGGAALALLFYLGKFVVPVGLLPVYPTWKLDRGLLLKMAVPVVALVLGGWWARRRGWERHAALGLGFFVLNLLPVAGLMRMKYLNFSPVADHFIYLPMIGLIALVAALVGYLDARLSSLARVGERILVAVVVVLMAWGGHAYAGSFADPDVFWNDLLRRDSGSWVAQLNLGMRLLDQQRYPEAIARLREVARLRPDLDDGYYNLGYALDQEGKTTEAEAQYRQAIAVNPNNADACLNLGQIMKRNGDLPEAEKLFGRVVQLEPDKVTGYTDLGGILIETGRASEALDLYRQAVELNPDAAQLRYDLGNVLLQTGPIPEAIEQLQAAVALDPGVAPAHENLGVALARTGQITEAIGQFEAALQIDPAYAAARDNLGLALAQTGHLAEAIEQFQKALQINPNDANARQCLAKLYELQKKGLPGK